MSVLKIMLVGIIVAAVCYYFYHLGKLDGADEVLTFLDSLTDEAGDEE